MAPQSPEKQGATDNPFAYFSPYEFVLLRDVLTGRVLCAENVTESETVTCAARIQPGMLTGSSPSLLDSSQECPRARPADWDQPYRS
jgi:hypothetical protein